ncbi:DMT family transporter [Patescibacteria group bacterium]
MLSKKEISGTVLILATAIISGFSIFINKIGGLSLDPYVFTGSKNFLVALIIFSSILISSNLKSFNKLKFKNWLTLLLIGIVGGGLPFLLFFKGLTLTSPAQASFIHKNMFLLAAPLALFFLKEKISRRFYLVAFVLLIGNALFFKLTTVTFGQGDLLILLAASLWAIESIISKKALKSLPVKTVAFGRMFFGSLFIIAFLLSRGQLNQITQLNLQQISWIVLTSLLLFGFVITWYTGLKLVRVSLATSILVLGSPVTALLSTIFINSTYSAPQIAGAILIFGGVLTVTFSRLQKPLRTTSPVSKF